MNTLSRTITGIIIIILGIFISFINLNDFVGMVMGIVIIVVGFLILFNKNEDDIEEIKDTKSLNKK